MSYQYIKPSEEQIAQMQVFRDRFEELHRAIEDAVPHSRGRSSCFTKLEEASFWLNKAITKND
jgi:hypothetical protein